MSRKPETQFIAGVHTYLPPAKDFYRAKVKNPYVAGLWDWWYSGLRADLWVEFKFIKLPKRDSTPILPNLSELQRVWGRGRHAEGRRLAVVVGCREGGVVLRDLRWETAMSPPEFRAKLQSRPELARWLQEQTM